MRASGDVSVVKVEIEEIEKIEENKPSESFNGDKQLRVSPTSITDSLSTASLCCRSKRKMDSSGGAQASPDDAQASPKPKKRRRVQFVDGDTGSSAAVNALSNSLYSLKSILKTRHETDQVPAGCASASNDDVTKTQITDSIMANYSEIQEEEGLRDDNGFLTEDGLKEIRSILHYVYKQCVLAKNHENNNRNQHALLDTAKPIISLRWNIVNENLYSKTFLEARNFIWSASRSIEQGIRHGAIKRVFYKFAGSDGINIRSCDNFKKEAGEEAKASRAMWKVSCKHSVSFLEDSLMEVVSALSVDDLAAIQSSINTQVYTRSRRQTVMDSAPSGFKP